MSVTIRDWSVCYQVLVTITVTSRSWLDLSNEQSRTHSSLPVTSHHQSKHLFCYQPIKNFFKKLINIIWYESQAQTKQI
jgi:hypothetical protein